MSVQFLFGQVLLWAGFVVAALAAVLRLEIPDNRWGTIPWPWYIAGMVLGTAGVVMLRTRPRDESGSGATSGGLAAARESLSAASRETRALADGIGNATCEEVLDRIDRQCVPHCDAFADARRSIQGAFGTSAYASVMTEFASGERYLNRAWSAAADGYVDEVESSIRHAAAFLDAARGTLDRLGAGQG